MDFRCPIWVVLAIVFMLSTGCTQKYINIEMAEDCELTVHGNIDPRFMREGTTEDHSITPKGELNVSAP